MFIHEIPFVKELVSGIVDKKDHWMEKVSFRRLVGDEEPNPLRVVLAEIASSRIGPSLELIVACVWGTRGWV